MAGLLGFTLADLAGAVDTRKRQAANLVRGLLSDPGMTLAQLAQMDAEQTQRDRATLGNSRSVMPEVRAQAQEQDLMNTANAGGLLGMIAYHGSPHKFDKFDMSKIGTGEGAQAYGHGLYFAENPAVAKQYAGDLAAAKATKPVGNVDLTNVYQNLPAFPDTLMGARKDFRTLNDMGVLEKSDQKDFLSAVRNNLTAAKRGNLYKVDIPDEAIPKMLDWDKPLSQQPEAVQKGVRKAFADAKIPDAWQSDPDGQSIHAWLSSAMGGKNNAELQRKGADILKQHGIPGIRYLDAGSRGKGGTSNFVLFDDSLPKIVGRE